ncbi:hypothetical protein N7451_005704 [Penicillium sp. IBT 35674x]|nr:hypothetical protein N7451_005704 [Penicillium sp. IBT 35674x]
MKKNENAVSSADNGLASRNSMQIMLPKAPSLDDLQATSVANTSSALETGWVERAGWKGLFLPMAKLPSHAIGQALCHNLIIECLGFANLVGSAKGSTVAKPRCVNSAKYLKEHFYTL